MISHKGTKGPYVRMVGATFEFSNTEMYLVKKQHVLLDEWRRLLKDKEPPLKDQ